MIPEHPHPPFLLYQAICEHGAPSIPDSRKGGCNHGVDDEDDASKQVRLAYEFHGVLLVCENNHNTENRRKDGSNATKLERCDGHVP